MPKPIEQRVDDLEDLMANIPGLISLRMESLRAGQQEASGRLDLVDRQVAIMVRDVREFRGAITRPLHATNSEIVEIKTKTSRIDNDMGVMRTDIAEMKTGLAEILSRLPKA